MSEDTEINELQDFEVSTSDSLIEEYKPKKKRNNELIFFIFLALILGILTGLCFPEVGKKCHVLASMFLNMIKMIIAPLLFATLVVGISGHENIKRLGKLGLKTIIYFEVITTLALVIGLGAGHLFNPGEGFNAKNVTAQQMETAQSYAATNSHASFHDIVINIVPTSIIEAMSTNNLLQIVIFAVFFAIAICAIGERGRPMISFLNTLADIMFKFTEIIMCFAPIGIFGAIAYTVSNNGPTILINYAKIIFALYFALLVFVLCILSIVCIVCKIPIKALLKAIGEPALLAFSTASSEAVLPQAMKIMENFGVPKNIVGFVMPTGYTFNLDGSTLYLALAVIFSTQIVGIELSLQVQLLMMLALMLTSKGMAGVPRVSLIVLAGTLSVFGYPIIGVAILLGIDQILDMGRTTVNLVGNCIATIIIACWEHCFDYDKMNRFITENDM